MTTKPEPYILCKCPTCGATSSLDREVFEEADSKLTAKGVCMACGELVEFTYLPTDYSKMVTGSRTNGKLSSRKPHW